jgi:hypothetical protein
MNYCTPYPVAKGLRDYLVCTLNILHPPRVLAGNQFYSAVKLPIHSLPWVNDLKLQRMDAGEYILKEQTWQPIN